MGTDISLTYIYGENDRIVFLMVARAFFDKGFKYEGVAECKEEYGEKVEFQFLGALGGEAVSGVT